VSAVQPARPGLYYDESQPIGTLWARDESWGGVPYVPQEGDVLLFGSVSVLFTLTFPLARTWHPWHSGLIVRRSTGDLAMLEDGGDDHPYAALRAPAERLPDWLRKQYWRPRTWVRRRRTPLTPEQSRALTVFAETQAYKPFATTHDFAIMLLPGRPQRRTFPDRDRWYCSELMLEALVTARIVCPSQIPRPEALAPYDILFDKRIDLSGGWHDPAVYSSTRQPPPPGPPLAPR
jgi:hypothetical protein